jgi:LysM repeat protein
MNRLCYVFSLVLLMDLLISACGPAAPTPAQPTQVVQIETQPTIVPLTPAIPTPLLVTATSSTGCPTPAGWSAYTVKPGDTLYALAKQTNQTPEEVMRANCLTSSIIDVGVTLYLPLELCTIVPPEGWRLYLVRSGDTLFSLATARHTSVAEIKRANCLVSDGLAVGQRLYLPPAPPVPVAPAPVAQPQTSSSEPTLPGEIFYAPGGEGQGSCKDAPGGQGLKIGAEGLGSRGDVLILCLYGFSNAKYLTVTFYTQDTIFGADMVRIITNSVGGGDVIAVSPPAPAGYVSPGTSNLALLPWWPPDLPETVQVQVDPGGSGASIQNAGLRPRASFLRTSQYAPFENRLLDHGCLVTTGTLPLQFVGAGFAGQKQIPIGLYYTESAGTPLRRWARDKAVTDGTGHFTHTILPKLTDSPGYYYAVAITDTAKSDYNGSTQIDCYKLQ